MPSISATIADGPEPLTAQASEFARRRGISRRTLEVLNVGSGTVFFPDLKSREKAIVFPYRDGWKARSIEGKSFVSSKGFKLSFFNESTVLAGSQPTIWITEGEFDACALVEAGIPVDAVLSVPNGARDKPAKDPKEMRGLAYVEQALRNGLGNRKYIWCGDADGPGQLLRSEMVHIFGAARFWFVDWPEGINDANDMLRKDGRLALRELVTDGAQLWPFDGLYRLSQLPDIPPLTLWQPGFPEWERKVMLAARTMSVVTGNPGHGKTALWGQIWQSITKQYDLVACVASFETRPKPHLRRQLRTLHSGKLESEMEWSEIKAADAWIEDHYLFATHPENRATLSWFFDAAEVAVVRHGASIIQADPWNRFESGRGRDETETEYIARFLREAHSFAVDMNCHVQVVAHPAKMPREARGKPPELEDISGSKHWDNMVDQGFVVHRPKLYEGPDQKTEAAMYLRKARYDELGRPCKLTLDYLTSKGRYVSADYKTGEYGER